MERGVVFQRFANGEERVVSGALRDVRQSGWNVMSSHRLAEPDDAPVIGTQQTFVGCGLVCLLASLAVLRRRADIWIPDASAVQDPRVAA